MGDNSKSFDYSSRYSRGILPLEIPLIHSHLNIYYTLEYLVFNILHNKLSSLFKV
jgi:hypothetical protein